jgi:hypothetical protein
MEDGMEAKTIGVGEKGVEIMQQFSSGGGWSIVQSAAAE